MKQQTRFHLASTLIFYTDCCGI